MENGWSTTGLPPSFAVHVEAPDIKRWLPGNTGVPGVWSFAAEESGPHVVLMGIVHGNEIAGAIVLDRLLRAELRPLRGRLSLAFANIEAYQRFDPSDPTATRFLEEDLNRLWEPSVLDSPRRSSELRRARALRPVIDSADVLLDMHSMLWPSEPLMLGGRTEKGGRLGLSIGVPQTIVLDEGHAAGERVIDYGGFSDPADPRAAVLVEGGPHWEPGTPDLLEQSALRLLRSLGMIDHAVAVRPEPPRLARVTRTVTAMTDRFAFLRDFRGGEVIAERNTIIALDGDVEIRTPHANCLLVMPTPQPPAGHTAVRLARFDQG